MHQDIRYSVGFGQDDYMDDDDDFFNNDPNDSDEGNTKIILLENTFTK